MEQVSGVKIPVGVVWRAAVAARCAAKRRCRATLYAARCKTPRPATPRAPPPQPPAALRKAIGQSLIHKALERSRGGAPGASSGGGGGGGAPLRSSEPLPRDLAEFGALLERHRAAVLLGLFVCVQVGHGNRPAALHEAHAARHACQLPEIKKVNTRS